MVKFVIRKDVYEELIEKGFGKKDMSKLTKKQITDKNGHTRNVWVRMGEEPKEERKGKQEVEEAKAKRSSSTDVTSNYSVGQEVSFEYGGNTLKGTITAKGKTGVTIRDDKNIPYKVEYNKINSVTKNSDGTIPPEHFSASDYRNKYQDSKIAELEKAHKGEGVKYFLDKYLPGKEGKEMAAKAAETEKRVSKQVEQEGETISRYRVSGDGISAVYSKERLKLHKKIFDYYFSPEKIKNATPKNGEKPKLVMLGGRAGAGKSWFTGEGGLYNKDDFVVLDSDAIKSGVYDEEGKELCPPLPEYEGWNAQTVHEESSDLNKMLIAEAKRLGVNIIIDGTMNSVEKSVKQIQDFKDAGYFTSCDYMFTPMQESMKRACGRFKTRKGDYSGRFVPLGIMTDMTKNEDAFEAVKGIVDRYSFRDNFNQTNGKATLICQKGDY